MNSKLAIFTALALAALLVTPNVHGQQATRSGASLEDKIAALREMRDSGLLSDQDYEAKVRALQGGSAAPAGHVSRLAWSGTHTVEARDSQFQMTAFTLEVPNGWRYAGEIGMSGQGTCHIGEPSLRLTMESPDGLYKVMQLPGVGWSANSDPRQEYNMAQNRCPAIHIFTAADFFANILLPDLHPNAKIVEVLVPGPGLEQAMQDDYQTAYQRRQIVAQAIGQPIGEFHYDGARVRIQFDQNGTPVEEVISGFVQCADLSAPGSPIFRSCHVSNMSLIQAPLGQLDALLATSEFAAMMQSRQPHRDWLEQQNRARQTADQNFVLKMNGDNQRFQAMMRNNQANYNAQYAANQRFYDTLNRGAQNFNHQLQVQGQNAIAQDRQRQDALDRDGYQHSLYYGDKQENINPYNGQTVITSNKSAQQWISNDGRTTVGTGNGVNPNDYVGPGGPTFAPMTPR